VARISLSRLAPAEWFPAGWSGITARRVALPDGTNLRVVEAGPADGTPVVMIHGWAVSAYLWRHTLAGLSAAGYRAIALDLPGHGLSDSPPARGEYTLDAFTRRVSQLLDALELQQPLMLAQSMGGRIGVALASQGRARKLALFGPVGFGSVTPATAYAPFIPEFAAEIATTLVTRQMVEIVQRRVHGKLGWFTDRDVDEYWAPTQFPGIVRAQLQMLREFSWAPLTPAECSALAVETLVVFGTQDKTVKPTVTAEIVARLPRGRLEWVEGGGHVLMEEIPAQVNAMLIEFLRAEG
jgi:pimeloyl-ACP methyl ester carboxylesterase